jgi:serine/threonine protein kinase
VSGDEQGGAADPNIGAQRGKFRVESRLGRGGLGTLYAGTELGSERRVVLEIMAADEARDEERVRRFLQEASALVLMSHEHVARFESVEQDGGGPPFVVRERLEGRTLEEVLSLEKRLPLARALRIGRQAGAGLAAAHKRGILHRDIGPRAIFLQHTEDGVDAVKVIGFGLARMPGRLGDDGVEPSASIHYASPEQLSRSKTVDARTDVYSLGAVLYRALAGHPPFDAAEPRRLLEVIAEVELPDLRVARPDVPERLAEVIRRACAKRPQDRFPKMTALVRELDAITADASGSPRRSSAPGGEPARRVETGRHHDGGGMILTEPRRREPEPVAPVAPPSRGSGSQWAIATIALLLVGTSVLIGYALGESSSEEPAIADAVDTTRAETVVGDLPIDEPPESGPFPLAVVAPRAETAVPSALGSPLPVEAQPPAAAHDEPDHVDPDEAIEAPVALVAPGDRAPADRASAPSAEGATSPVIAAADVGARVTAEAPAAPEAPSPPIATVTTTPPTATTPPPSPPTAAVAALPASAADPGPTPSRPCIGIWRFRDARGAYRLELRTPERAGACGTATFESQSSAFFGNCSGTIIECEPTSTGGVGITFARDEDETGACVFPREWSIECSGDGGRAHLGPRRGSIRLQRARR